MSLFYDPKDSVDQARVEAILRQHGISYRLLPEPVTNQGPMQIYVGEKDLPRANELILMRGKGVRH